MRAISTIAKPPRGHGPLLQVVSPTRTNRIPSDSSSLKVVMGGIDSPLLCSPCVRLSQLRSVGARHARDIHNCKTASWAWPAPTGG
jgi:hypothetical protein